MASIFELEKPTFSRVVPGITLVEAAANANKVLKAEECIETLVTMTPDSARTLTTATGAAIIAAIPGCQVGTTTRLIVQNHATTANTLTLTAAASGVTIDGKTTEAVAGGKTAVFLLRVTNIDPGSENIDIYSIGQSAH